ncbi:MAG: preprotein translocase subunit YajC [Hyphomicrobiales bacterium]|nr:preprotein translocase subunit YajC [Hyphomicrobiales bacterium]
MFVTSAQAHSAVNHTVFDHQAPVLAQAAGGSDMLMSILPFILIFVIMYFLILRPQRKQMKERQEMLANISRNDTVVTGGGIVGRVTKVIDDHELEVEIAKDTKVRAMRSLVAEVRVKGQVATAAKRTAGKTAEKKPAVKK